MKKTTAQSDVYAWRAIDVAARFDPERYSRFGYAAADEQVLRLPTDVLRQQVAAFGELAAALRRERDAATDPGVRLDLEIMIGSLDREVDLRRCEDELLVPVLDVPQAIFAGFQALLDDKVPAQRRRAAAARLERYTGLDCGFASLTRQFEDLVRSRLGKPDLLPPFRQAVERALATSATYFEEIGKLLGKYQVPGHEEPYRKLCEQGKEWEAFVRAEILPRTPDEPRLSPELYAGCLRWNGVDLPADELLSRAWAAIRDLRREICSLVGRRTAGKSSSLLDHLELLRQLEEGDQFDGEKILSHYRRRFRRFRHLVERHDVLTFPQREPRLVTATAAENAAMPFPYTVPPSMFGEADEGVEIVLPFRVCVQAGEPSEYTSSSFSWIVAIHEGAHAVYYASHAGLPLARRCFATASEVEGWALYLEAELVPHLSLAARTAFLRWQLARAVRTCLEVSLHLGTMSFAETARALREAIGFPQRGTNEKSSGATLDRELARFYLMPGRGPSAFYGASRAGELRAEAELALGREFDRREYHDFVLAQGDLPSALLRQRVFEEHAVRARPELAA